MEIKLKIVLDDGTEIELTRDQAKELLDTLKGIFQPPIQYQPISVPGTTWEPNYFPPQYIITCGETFTN